MPAEEWEAMLTAEAPYDACHYIGQAAPAQLFFQFARHDSFISVQDAEHYFQLASSPKQIAWYEDCNLDRARFLCAQLGLPELTRDTLALLERVPPPASVISSRQVSARKGSPAMKPGSRWKRDACEKRSAC